MASVPVSSDARRGIACEISMARDALNRARDGVPVDVHEDPAFLDYSLMQIDKAVSYALRAKQQLQSLKLQLAEQLAASAATKGRMA